MSTVSVNSWQGGDLLSALDVNTDLTAIETETIGLLNPDNTHTEWCTRQHIADSLPKVFNRDHDLAYSNLTQLVNWNTFTLINLGGATPMRATGPFVLEPGQVLRVHFDINVNDLQFPTPVPDTGVGATAQDDCYEFAFQITTPLSTYYGACRAVYSASTFPRDPVPAAYTTAFRNELELHLRKKQRCNMSAVIINTSGANLTINNVEAHVRIRDLVWIPSLTLKNGEISAFVGAY